MVMPAHDPPARRGFDEAYALAYQIAADSLKKVHDLHALCHKSGATMESEAGHTLLRLDYIGQHCMVTLPDVEVVAVSGNPLTQRDRLIILHYLNTADGGPLAGKPVTFKELPEGTIYYPTFVKRAVKPVLDKYADTPEALMAAAEKLGGAKTAGGDFAFKIKALPHVPITVTLWLGDAELPSEANILFDASVTDYLPTEDITVLCEILAWKLVKSG
jgi:hypothetical protein